MALTQLIGLEVVAVAVVAPRAFTYNSFSGTLYTGAALTGSFETGGTPDDQHWQRIVRWRGANTWVAVVRDSIFRSTNAGSSWSVVYGPDADLGTTVVKSGLQVGTVLTQDGWEPRLAIFSKSDVGAADYFLFTSSDGVTWSKAGPFTFAVGHTMALQGATWWRNVLYVTAGLGASARTYAINLQNSTAAEIGGMSMAVGFNDASFAVFNDELYGVWTTGLGAPAVRLWKFANGAWTSVASVSGVSPTVASGQRKSALFVQGTSLYAAFVEEQAPGPVWEWKIFQFPASITPFVDVTTAVFAPIAGSGTVDSRLAVLVDGPAGGGGFEVPYLFLANDGLPPSVVSVWQFNGAASAITASGGAPSSPQTAFPFGVQIGGNVFWTSGQRTIERIRSAPGNGGARWTFRLYSPNSPPDLVNVRAFYGTRLEEYPSGPTGPNDNAVLADPSAGTLVGQTITGLDAADNGATDFQVTWAFSAQTQAIGNGEPTKTVLEVF